MAQIGKSSSVAVNSLGKIKTIAQMVAIPMLLFHDRLFGRDRCAPGRDAADLCRGGAHGSTRC